MAQTTFLGTEDMQTSTIELPISKPATGLVRNDVDTGLYWAGPVPVESNPMNGTALAGLHRLGL
eukprot:3169359-Lingulodinium_polyedra.AAC.1